MGYWENDEETGATLRDGWLYTGDLVAAIRRVFWLWAERRRSSSGVANISSQEVEDALYQHPAVLQAGVIGKPHPVYGEQVVAFVTLREGQTAGEEQLIEFAGKRLANYKKFLKGLCSWRTYPRGQPVKYSAARSSK